MRLEDQIKRCSELLYRLCDDVQRMNNLNYFDINITCEYFYIQLLNLVFGWNLRNENLAQKNVSTIDLVDNENRIAIQVTSDKNANKIHNTLKSFREKKLYEQYDRLIFIVIVKKKSYSANFEPDIQGAFLFDEKRDIYTLDKLIRKIQDLGYQKVAEICEYLEFELGVVKDPNRVWTASAAFQDISDNTNGFLNEDFFEIDDYRFKDKFKCELEREPIEIHINGSDREETMYCILNHIHTLVPDKQIYIIRDEQSWIAAKDRLVDCIVIPFFVAAQIPALQGNINIFIHGAQKHHKSGIELRRRTKSFLNAKLQKNNYKDSYTLIKKTNGIYYFLKKELYQGTLESPTWAQDQHIAVICSIMIGSWCQSNGDKQVLETVSQKPFSELMEYLERYTNCEMPLILKRNYRDQVSYEIADPELAWFEVKYSFSEGLCKQFLSMIKPIISDKTNMYSELLKRGMLRSLIFLAIHNYKQSAVDRSVKEVLSDINCPAEWNSIANYIQSLCEASPQTVLSRLQSGLHDESGLLDLFSENASSFSWEGSNYIQILWAAEMLLGNKQHAIGAIRWLMELGNCVGKCSSGNNPRETVLKIFCIYYNNAAVSVDEKIYLAKEGLEKYSYLWDILFEQLPYRTRISILPVQEFTYREDDDFRVKKLSWAEINQQRLAMYNQLFAKINSNIDKWLKMLQLFPHITDSMLDAAFDALMTDLKKMQDSDRERIQYELREIIYDHRFFIDADWSADEKHIARIEAFCKSICFDDPSYKYLYLTRTNNFPIFAPTPYSDKGPDGYYSMNQKKRRKILQEEFAHIKNEGLELACFLQKIDKTKLYGIGYMIAEFYSDGKYSEETLKKMLTVSEIGEVIADYIRWCYYNDTKENYANALTITNGYESSGKLYYYVLQIPPVDQDFLEMLDQMPPDTQKGYWISSFGIHNLSSPDIIDFIMPKLFEYKLWKKALQIINHFKSQISNNQLMEYLDTVLCLVDDKESYNDNMTKYEIDEIVAYLEHEIDTDEQCSSLLKIELTHLFVIGWDHAKYVQHHIKENARLFAAILSKAFNYDNSDRMRYRRLYDAMHFCPGEMDGHIDRSILKEWIEEFQLCLEKYKQEDMFYSELGRLFAYSPIGTDEIMPHEIVRDMIEEYGNEQLINSYIITTFNQRGVYTVTYGESEYKMASNFKCTADRLRLKWPRTAEIYDDLFRRYDADSWEDRLYGEDYYQ